VAAEVPERRRRLWPWIVGGVVVIMVALAGFWLVFVPNWRPALRDRERYGVDVSALIKTRSIGDE
jgi:hypothetical protein